MKKRLGAVLTACMMITGVFTGCVSDEENELGNDKMGRYAEEELTLPEGLQRLLGSSVTDEGEIVYYGTSADNSIIKYILPPEGELKSEKILESLKNDGLTVSKVSESKNGVIYSLCYDNKGSAKLVSSDDRNSYQFIEMPEWDEFNNSIQIDVSGNTKIGAMRFGDADEEASDAQTHIIRDGEESQPDNPQQGPRLIKEGNSENGNSEQEPTEGNGAPINVVSIRGGSIGGGMGRIPGMDNLLMPSGLFALDDGFIILYGNNGAHQYDAMGKLLYEYGGFGNSAALYENSLAIADLDKKEINIYDILTGAITESLSCSILNENSFIGMGEKGVFIADNSGIYSGEEWELEVDGGLTSLIMPDNIISSLVCDKNGNYYALLGENNYNYIKLYYDESIPSEPDITLELFSLADNNTIRLAIGEFQRKNPNVKVNLRIGMDDESSATAEDVIRALNTEIIAGKGPDLFLLDGLPVESYIEKGVLKDISELSQQLVTNQGLMENFSNAYGKDGKIYGLPSRFTVPVMIGDRNILEATNSLSDLSVAVTNTPSVLYGSEKLWEDNGLMMEYYEACLENWTLQDGTIDQAALEDYFNNMLNIDSAMKEITPQSGKKRMGFISMGGGGSEEVDFGSQAIKDGTAQIHIQELSGLLNYTLIAQNLSELPDMEIVSLFNKNKYYSKCGVGISTASEHQDLAESFAALLVSEDVQDKYLYDGFPVNINSLNKMLNERLETIRENSGEIGDMEFIELCESLTNAVFADKVIKDAVEEQVKDLISGTVTGKEAAAKVAEKTKLYLAE